MITRIDVQLDHPLCQCEAQRVAIGFVAGDGDVRVEVACAACGTKLSRSLRGMRCGLVLDAEPLPAAGDVGATAGRPS